MNNKEVLPAKPNFQASALIPVLDCLEGLLETFYQFRHNLNVREFLAERHEVQHLTTDNHLHNFTRSGVLLHEDAEAVDIGVYFDPNTVAVILSSDPIQRLDLSNINATCVLIEEVSHFHLIVNRSMQHRTTTHLELELQAELDKFILCALLLEYQFGHGHHHQLYQLLFKTSAFKGSQIEVLRYQHASNLAARFVRFFLKPERRIRNPDLKSMMREFYELPFSAKAKFLRTF